jgi:RHS repeat-associated protein
LKRGSLIENAERGQVKRKRGQPLTRDRETYTYDTIGRVASHTNPKGNTTSLIRDGMGRVTRVTYQDQSTKTYAYNCCNLTTVSDSNGTINFVYDTLKRLQSLTDIYGKTLSYAYDKNHNLITLTYPDGKVVGYEYDKANRLIKVTDWLSNITTYQYDTIGNLFKTTYPNGSTINYQYDNTNRLKAIVDMKSDGTLNALYKYTLDQLGNRTKVTSYQPLNAIPPSSNTNYSYDIDNRMLTAGAETFDYDNNGNLITKTSEGEVTNYTWDFNDMLTQVTNGSNTYIYRYDGLGSRVARIENGAEKRYVSGLVETDASGSITAYYVYGLGLISKITPSNEVYYYHYDGIGNTIGISDPLGNMVNKYAYDEFGKVLSQEEAVENPFKYVGQFGVMDEGNGLFYMRARYYDPEVGIFISKDPIGFAGGLNLYGYVQNNPVNLIDPEGLEGEEWRFDPYDHGGPHFQRGIDRYDPNTLKPVPHKGKIPPELSKSAIKELQQSKAWTRWLKYLAKVGKIAGVTIGILLELGFPAEAQAPGIEPIACPVGEP